MTEMNDIPDKDSEIEHYPLEPHYHPLHKIPRNIYDFLASAKLAMFLLVAILSCCVGGVTVFRGERAWLMIFSTLWFNGLLVLLVVNVACCFFGRIWGRRITIVSFGMILFHLSFVAMFFGIVYGSLYSFVGSLRLTEGESLPNGQPESYDIVRHGRFFRYEKLHGVTTLDKMHVGYRIEGKDKRVAYDVSIVDDSSKKTGTIYATHSLNYHGVGYFRDKEGYSPLVVLSDREGKELYSAYVSLQSLKQKDGTILYSSGSRKGPGMFHFPQAPEPPRFALQLTYKSSKLVERGGDAYFQVYELDSSKAGEGDLKPIAEGKAAVGETFDAGDYRLSVKEVRYWVAMTVRYDPGKPIVLASLWVGLGGMVITTVGRVMRRRSGKYPASVQ